MLSGEDIEYVRPEHHAAQRQPHRLGKADSARKSWNADDQCHEHRELPRLTLELERLADHHLHAEALIGNGAVNAHDEALRPHANT